MSNAGKQLLKLGVGILVLIVIVALLYLVGYQPTDFIYQNF